ncbi:MAG: Na+:solute symporter [Saprospiraceae bacterium]|nr:Na+:solute symporter [Saprospiraceae bacterium]MBP7679624.1 Na+:solute symporter [Saprospiraceae bacterium]
MTLNFTDWISIFAFFVASLLIGVIVSKRSGKDTSEFFLSGRTMPWWLLGISLVATTFSADTPNLVTDIVRKNGVSGNWVWWAFLLTGMLTVFVYAKLWRRSESLTDLEFYELRYSGKAAAFLRGFRALYLGVFFNVMIMATVSLAAIKIGGVMLGLSPIQTIAISSVIIVIYSSIGGFTGVIWTDFFQFGIAMLGAVLAAVIVLDLPQVNGLSGLLSHPNVQGKLSLMPDFNNTNIFVPIFLIPIAVQWWSVWYPGAEPGGGGYVAQRMLAAKDENHSMGATLLFNILHYGLRPWPWIIVALASLIVYPDIASLKAAYPNLPESVINDDLAYSAMLTFLPHGVLGLIIASLIAAYMSTIATHLNWGSSYVVNDFYKRFINPTATEKQLVSVGRISTVVLMLLSAVIALALSNALSAFNILLQIGAGTGLLFILRWFWWRINAQSELAAMIVSFLIAFYFEFVHTRILGLETFPDHIKLLIGVAITTVCWVAVAFSTAPTEYATLLNFYKKIRPAAMGWQPLLQKALDRNDITPAQISMGRLPTELSAMFVGCVTVYATVFATGYWIYGNTSSALISSAVAAVGSYVLFVIFKKLR